MSKSLKAEWEDAKLHTGFLSAGKILHSHSYRYAECFAGQAVVVLGAKASGLDISIELAKVGAQVMNTDAALPGCF